MSTAAIIATSEVPMAALFGSIILGETLGLWQALGAGLVILGVVLVSVGKKQASIKISVDRSRIDQSTG